MITVTFVAAFVRGLTLQKRRRLPAASLATGSYAVAVMATSHPLESRRRVPRGSAEV